MTTEPLNWHPPGAESATPEPARAFRPTPGRVLLGGAAAMLAGSVLPWVSATAPFVGTIEVNGTEGDGVLTFLLAIVVAVFGFPLATRPAAKGRVIAALVAAVLGVAVCVFNVINIETAAGQDVLHASVGFGLWLTTAGSLVAAVGAISGLRLGRTEHTFPATSP